MPTMTEITNSQKALPLFIFGVVWKRAKPGRANHFSIVCTWINSLRLVRMLENAQAQH